MHLDTNELCATAAYSRSGSRPMVRTQLNALRMVHR